jgi:hypothetical protein
LPPEFPGDVCVYEGGIIEIAEVVDGDFIVSIRTPDTKMKISGAYEREMASQGWAREDISPGGPLIFVKNDRVASVTMLSEDESTLVGLTVSKA